ncbi:TlpA family protein disulfide reductase [Capnocytophaga catalasegens]|uniref:Thioredoxin domain-containing protein n=1 Tax=Capnocytophaga catalasegens TaxID=1004260 RepID=A0AAV5AUF4_9FLAO|nr:TlpA disulfide reductase family protein [Capnocytophaga catalasegens]GIZ14931.1 hypothetical protein RCZ03_09310 [Capnocytophaga catalasegens]GJM49310.1 hypothetical protein RCZ15_02850 [Capnocytophaga catalasegens]GJM52461.1 hypothetical protein RCZ16_07780 [Capnocytophaga catalasegens]
MKHLIITFLLTLIGLCGFSQNYLSNIELKNLENKSVNIATYNTVNHPIIISFWATWCAPCIKELKTFHKHYKQWQSKYNVELLAIATDDAKTKNRVKSLVKGAQWQYTIFFDDNQELKRSLNIANIPYTLILYKGKAVFVHSGYTPGVETEIEKKLQLLTY